jgi:RNA polymerase sigma-70 factor, ECF subfamily
MLSVSHERSEASHAMDAYADGDAAAFDVLYDRLAPRLYAYVRRLTRADAVAEDITQQSFLRLHQARGSFVRGTRVEPWAYAIARRLTIDWARRERVDWDGYLVESLVAGGLAPDERAAGAELASALRKELELVSPGLCEAFILIRVEGLSSAEAGKVLGITALGAKLRAHRAGLLLRPRLARFGTTEGEE